jgi:beta-glucuronidase
VRKVGSDVKGVRGNLGYDQIWKRYQIKKNGDEVLFKVRFYLLLGLTLVLVASFNAPLSASAGAGQAAVPAGDTFAKEPMDTVARTIDGVGVVFQYGKPVPSFDTWDAPELTREVKRLDGQWKFSFDPQNQGVAQGWLNPDFDDSAWKPEQVPGSWDLYDTPGFGTYDGTNFGQGSAFQDGYAWYRTSVMTKADWNHKFVKLNFLGAGYKTWVYVNGKFVGAHEGGYTPFSLDISDALIPGKPTTIAVRVYRSPSFDTYTGTKPTAVRDATSVPPGPVDYWPYAGITRSVYLEASSDVTVSKLLTSAGNGKLHLDAVLYNHGTQVQKRLVATEPGIGTGGTIKLAEATLQPGEVKVLPFDFDIPLAKQWDTAHPNLYTAGVTLLKGEGLGEVDQLQGLIDDQLKGSNADQPTGLMEDRLKAFIDDRLTVQYGMRTIEVKDGKLLLNGNQVLLKGVNWHEETAAHGRSMTIPEFDTELGMVKDLNANFIRNSVYNRHPYVYEYADKNGLLVLDDIDNMWLKMSEQKLQTESYGLSRALALTMAWNQIDHPSVIMWSLQNESDIWTDRTVYRNWIADMKQAVKSVDIQNRPVTWASGSSWDPAFDLADVIGFNEYFGYFYGKNSDLGTTLDAVHKQYPDRPILITENGSWSFLGNHGSPDVSGTEEWQANNFQSHWDQIMARTDYMAGYTFWNLKDYKERENYNQVHNGISYMGLVTFDNEAKRLVYNTFKNAANPFPGGQQ